MDQEKKPLAPARAWQLNTVIVLLVLFVAVSLFPRHTPETKWEYSAGSIPDKELSETLNRLGGEGWELVFARRASNNLESAKPDFQYEMIFRRPVKARSLSIADFF